MVHALAFALASVFAAGAQAHATQVRHNGVTTYQGTFADGATYLIQVPSNWNGQLVLYSHGYVAPGGSNPAYDVGDPVTGKYLLTRGYALGGSSYATTGWAVQQALPDQMEVLSTFATLVGTPSRTIAWGHSLGGMITAALVQQYPASFTAALPMCGVVGGGVGIWNSVLDSAFAFNTLLAADQLQVVDITNPYTNFSNAESDLNTAQGSAQGRARIALVAALADVPGWYKIGYPPPPPRDYADQEANQYQWLSQADFLFAFYLRAELEGRARGNPSWNDGIDYRNKLAKSADLIEVQKLYRSAGLDLNADLQTLATAPRISADSGALQYLSQNIIFDGRISVPVLTLHTEGDGLVVNENESGYEAAVRGAGDSADLRQLFIFRAGHCAFTPAEQIAAFEALEHRLDSGKWSGLEPSRLNSIARALGSGYNPLPPEFDAFAPGPYLRTYNGMP
jgi:pimeloyl-ACP methyl ester carboxylesterase